MEEAEEESTQVAGLYRNRRQFTMCWMAWWIRKFLARNDVGCRQIRTAQRKCATPVGRAGVVVHKVGVGSPLQC
jgi:hypothetical protein